MSQSVLFGHGGKYYQALPESVIHSVGRKKPDAAKATPGSPDC